MAVPKNFQKGHHPIRKLLEADSESREKMAKGELIFSWDKPKFESPFERRRLRLLSAIFNGLQKQGMKPSVRGEDARELAVQVNQRCVSFSVDDANVKPFSEQNHYHQSPKSSGRMKVAIGGWEARDSVMKIWEDTKNSPVEKCVTDIVGELIVTAERQLRAGAQRRYEWMVQYKAELIEEARREKEEVERKERERITRLEQERIDRLLADAQTLRQARDIRAYVQEVTELCTEDYGDVSPEALREWRQWALAQADRIDPVVSGGFRKSMEDPADDAPES